MKLTDYIKTIVPLAVILFFALQKGSGFGLPLMLSAFLVAALLNVARAVRRPEERKRSAVRLAIWAAALVIAGSVIAHWAHASREEADLAVKTILAYKARTGAYPKSLNELALNEQALQEQWGIRYLVHEGSPVLVYPSSTMPLTTYDYDFQSGKWVENSY